MRNLFIAVKDTNRKRIRGLWQRGEKYYLQVRVPGESAPRKIPLKAASLSEAKTALESRRTELRQGNVPARGRKPGFSDCAEEYLRVLENSERPGKSARTIYEERLILEKWKAALHNTRIDQITAAQIPESSKYSSTALAASSRIPSSASADSISGSRLQSSSITLRTARRASSASNPVSVSPLWVNLVFTFAMRVLW